MSDYMNEYIMGLGISVKICKIYEKLIYLMIKEEHNTDDFLNEFLRGNTKLCIELVKKDGQTLELIDRICKPW